MSSTTSLSRAVCQSEDAVSPGGPVPAKRGEERGAQPDCTGDNASHATTTGPHLLRTLGIPSPRFKPHAHSPPRSPRGTTTTPTPGGNSADTTTTATAPRRRGGTAAANPRRGRGGPGTTTGTHSKSSRNIILPTQGSDACCRSQSTPTKTAKQFGRRVAERGRSTTRGRRRGHGPAQHLNMQGVAYYNNYDNQYAPE